MPRGVRHQRYDGHGNVWCYRCQRFRPADMFRWVEYKSRNPGYWSYCKPCVIEIDRERYRQKTATLEGAERVLASRYERKRRHRQQEIRERRQFIAHAVDVMKRRGFTQKDICTLTGITWTTFWTWEKRGTVPTRNAEERVSLALQITGQYPIGDTPAYRRRKPHPDLPFLSRRLAPQLEKYPIRNAWKNGKRTTRRKTAA